MEQQQPSSPCSPAMTALCKHTLPTRAASDQQSRGRIQQRPENLEAGGQPAFPPRSLLGHEGHDIGWTYSHYRTCLRGQACASVPHGTAIRGAGREPHLVGNAAAAFLCRNSLRVGAKGKLLETERGTTHLPWSWKGWGGKYPPAERPAAVVTD